jgi:heat shock protein 4
LFEHSLITFYIGLKQENIDFIELVGEATRIPICIKQIQEVFGKEPSRTLNSTDCIARGCALQAAMLSPNFQVANFEVEEYNVQPIAISYKFQGTEKVVTKELFTVGSSFPSTKSITFENKTGNLDLMVHYADNAVLMKGLPNQISQYNIAKGKIEDKTEKHSFTMRVSNNIHNVAQLDEVEFIQEWTEMEKIPIKASPVVVPPKKEEEKKEEKKEGEAEAEAKPEEKPEEPKAEVKQPEQQYETKERKKKTFSQISFTSSSFALAPNQRKAFADIENTLVAEDFDILEQKELRNMLEAYSYEMRNNLDSYGTFEKYLDETTKAAFLKDINEVVEWIYGDGENAPKAEYRTRLEKFKTIGEPVKSRHFYYSELDLYFSQFETLAKTILSRSEVIEHITPEQ